MTIVRAMARAMASQVAGSVDLMTNGGFDADALWTKGANWTIADGKASKTSGATNNLTHTTLTAVIGRTYRVEYTISNYGGLGGLTPSMGASGMQRTSNGTFVDYITATGATAFSFIGGTSFSGDVDNVSVRQVPDLKP